MRLLAFDFETTGLEFWKPDFKVISCAFAIQQDGNIETWSVDGQDSVKEEIQHLLLKYPEYHWVCHNYKFEYSVLTYILQLSVKNIVDTMRLAQVYDNFDNYLKVSKKFGRTNAISGRSLVACCSRVIPDYVNHKQRAIQWVLDNIDGANKKNWGSYISHLPSEILREYEEDDAKYTFMLADNLIRYFREIEYDWTNDHKYYLSSTRFAARAHYYGVRVDQVLIEEGVNKLNLELTEKQKIFFNTFKRQIREIEAEKIAQKVLGVVTDAGIQNRLRVLANDLTPIKFNFNSTKDMENLFILKLKHKPRFFTENGAPTFANKFLHQYGEDGELLLGKGAIQHSLNQASTIRALSKHDNKWHLELNPCGTSTGRMTSSSDDPDKGAVNCQAMARKEPRLMRAIIPEPGYTNVSIDIGSAEPSVVAQFSKDQNYLDATFRLVGKEPYWDNDLLKIDDIYLTMMSISPLGKELIQELWNTKWGSAPFSEHWVNDKKSILAGIKPARATHKALALALSYFAGANRLEIMASKEGVYLTNYQAKELYNKYWETFKQVKILAAYITHLYKTQGWFENVFGYRLTPDANYKCFNHWIQSSVSPIINWFADEYFTDYSECPGGWDAVIHDELVFQHKTSTLSLGKEREKMVEEKINKVLGWDVRITFGWVEGANWYEAK